MGPHVGTCGCPFVIQIRQFPSQLTENVTENGTSFGNNPFVSLRGDTLFNKTMFGLSQGLCYFLLSRFHLHALRTYSSGSLFFSQVRAIGMASPELLQLVENCPTGAETLIARILNIITDKGKVFFYMSDILVANIPLTAAYKPWAFTTS